jgi:hypothetical protein
MLGKPAAMQEGPVAHGVGRVSPWPWVEEKAPPGKSSESVCTFNTATLWRPDDEKFLV